jgi:hypothetical protein
MTLQLENYGVSELSHSEQQETDGGFLPLLIVGAVLLLASCTGNNTNSGVNTGTQVNVQNGQNSTSTKVDSASVKVNGSIVPQK